MIERILERDLYVKIISVLIGIGLWLYVLYEQSPDVLRTVRDLPVQLEDLPEGLALVGVDPLEVAVTVRGTAGLIDDISEDDFTARVSLAGASAGQFARFVNVALPEGLQIVEVTPPQVIVFLEPVAQRRLRVEISVDGEPAEEYRSLEPFAFPSLIGISGAESLTAEVARVVSGVNISGARETVEFDDVRVYAIDATGRQVQGVTIDPPAVKITVPVEELPPRGMLPVEAALKGEPASGFEVQEVLVRPRSIPVRAPQPVLLSGGPITTEAVDLTGRSATFTTEVPLIFPGAVIPDTEDEAVQVTVVIAPVAEPDDEGGEEDEDG